MIYLKTVNYPRPGLLPVTRLLTIGPRDAATYITKLPKAERDAPEWLAAIQALMLVVEHGGDTMLPRIGIMRALYPGKTAPTPPKKLAKYRIVR